MHKIMFSELKGTMGEYQSHAITCYFTACDIILDAEFIKTQMKELHGVKLEHPSTYI